MKRILAVDYGESRVGLAISDPTGTIAQPLPTLTRRRGRRPPFGAISEIVREREVGKIVVGLPIETGGEEGPQAERVRQFGSKLEDRAGVPVVYMDERLTSARAKRELARLELPAAARREKERVDAMAATFILQSYMAVHDQE